MKLLKELLIATFVCGMSMSLSAEAQNDRPSSIGRGARSTTSSSRPSNNNRDTGIGSGARPSSNTGIGSGARPSSNTGIGSGARPSSNTGIGSGARPNRNGGMHPNNNYTPNYRPNQGPDNNYGSGNRRRPNSNHNSGIGSGARPNNNHNSGIGSGARPNNNHNSGIGSGARPNGNYIGHHGAPRPGYRPSGDGPRHTGSSWTYRPRAPRYYRPVPRPSTWRYYPNSPVINSVFGIVFGSSMNYVINQLSRQYYNVVGSDGNTVYLENVRMDGYNWTYADLNFDNDAMYQAQYTNVSTSNSILRYENLVRYYTRLYGPAINAYNNGNNALRWFGRNNSIILEYTSGYSQEGVMLYYTTLSYNYDYIYESIY